MLKRKILGELAKWNAAKNHKPVILKGCRQCGKTFAVLEHLNMCYNSHQLEHESAIAF